MTSVFFNMLWCIFFFKISAFCSVPIQTKDGTLTGSWVGLGLGPLSHLHKAYPRIYFFYAVLRKHTPEISRGKCSVFVFFYYLDGDLL